MPPRQRASSGFQQHASPPRNRSISETEKTHQYYAQSHLIPDDSDGGVEDADTDYPSSYSSRTTSGSHQSQQPMLSTAYSRRPNRPFFLTMRQSFMQRICLILAVVLLIFMFTLVHLSWSSDKRIQVELGRPGKAPPAAWESFLFLDRYYGGIRKLVPRSQNIPEYPTDPLTPLSNTTSVDTARRDAVRSQPFNPYPAYHSEEYTSQHGAKVDCFLDQKGTIQVPAVRVYAGVPSGFPDPAMGNNSLFGMRDDICYDRFGRLGPYGLGYGLSRGGTGAALQGDREGVKDVWAQVPEVDYKKIRWAEVQQRCMLANKARFADLPASQPEPFMQKRHRQKREERQDNPGASTDSDTTPKKLGRTAVIIRTWSDFQYTPEAIVYLRSIITELSLNTGGEYTVHFLIQVKDDNAPIWSDDDTYQRVLRESLPEEFYGMGVLWSERQMGLVYGGLGESFARNLPVHGVYRSTFMSLQFFAYNHPEYDFVWNWEMDIRYTGHWYHFFESVSRWAEAQPRKGLWERNGRFYIPSEHGSWEDFRQMVRVQTQHGTSSPNNMWSGLRAGGGKTTGSGIEKKQGDVPIWGPERPVDDDIVFPTDPVPPTTMDADKSTWGVNEPADLITFNPMFDPAGTTWLLADDYTGYNTTRSPPPRRTAIITASRLSRRLLTTMHRETALKRHTMFSEMWPASCALHHGLKAVYAPHAEYIDRRWPTKYLEATFNAGRNGATGGARTSVFGHPEHNFRGTTWYYNAGFSEVLWHRWLGYKFNNDGGEEFEVKGVGKKGGGEGRMCLPAMLMHPIKQVDMVIEGKG